MRFYRLVAILLTTGFILATSVFWRTNSPASPPLLECSAQAAMETSLTSIQAKCGFGKRWEVSEGCWKGVYVRRGNSNVFDAEWNLLDGRKFTAEVTIDIQGNRVSVQRRNATLGGTCEVLNGTLSANGVIVTGASHCNHPEGQVTSCFVAKIECDGSGGGNSTPVTWETTATAHRGKNGNRFTYTCPSGSGGVVWGTDLYTDDSSICKAAQHAGLISGAGGTVTIEMRAGQSAYTASNRNGVESRSYGGWHGSYVFIR